MAKEITVVLNAQITLIETGTDEEFEDLEERIGFMGGIDAYKYEVAAKLTKILKTDGVLRADDVHITGVKIFFGDRREENGE